MREVTGSYLGVSAYPGVCTRYLSLSIGLMPRGELEETPGARKSKLRRRDLL